MPGMGKFLFRPLAFAVLASLFLALTFVPSRCAAWLRKSKSPVENGGNAGNGGGIFGRVDSAFQGLTRGYERG